MDILNFISWIRGGRQVKTVDPAKTLLPVGLKDGRRDDDYLAGAITVQDFAATLKPYKVYTALLSQTGTSDPIATVLENTFTGSISFKYDSAGVYIIESSASEFVLNKTLTQIQMWGNDPKDKGRVGNVEYSTTAKLYLRVSRTLDPGNLTNGIGTNNIITSIEIRVYN